MRKIFRFRCYGSFRIKTSLTQICMATGLAKPTQRSGTCGSGQFDARRLLVKAISPADLRQRVEQYKWWHIMDLGHGVVTPGFYDPVGPEHVKRFAVPKNLTGKTVLDVGC